MELSDTFDSKFRVAIIVARRAKQLINGAKKLVDIEAENPLTIAIEEVNRGLVTPELLDNVNFYLEEANQDESLEEIQENIENILNNDTENGIESITPTPEEGESSENGSVETDPAPEKVEK